MLDFIASVWRWLVKRHLPSAGVLGFTMDCFKCCDICYVTLCLKCWHTASKLTLQKEVAWLQYKAYGLLVWRRWFTWQGTRNDTAIARRNSACLGVQPLENRWFFVENKIRWWCWHARSRTPSKNQTRRSYFGVQSFFESLGIFPTLASLQRRKMRYR